MGGGGVVDHMEEARWITENSFDTWDSICLNK